jgi:hypothetical protein
MTWMFVGLGVLLFLVYTATNAIVDEVKALRRQLDMREQDENMRWANMMALVERLIEVNEPDPFDN